MSEDRKCHDWLPVNSSYGHLVTRSCRHSVNSSQVNSSQARFFHRVISSHGQVVTQSFRHKRTLYKATNVQNLGDSRDNCFSLTPPLKILFKFSIFFHILLTTIRPTNGEKYKKIVGSVFEKISLENRKSSNFAYSLTGRFILAIFNCTFN